MDQILGSRPSGLQAIEWADVITLAKRFEVVRIRTAGERTRTGVVADGITTVASVDHGTNVPPPRPPRSNGMVFVSPVSGSPVSSFHFFFWPSLRTASIR